MKYNSIPPFSETQNYIAKVLNNYINYKNNMT
jgi:soluble lytic murein transglycosylase-like protein